MFRRWLRFAGAVISVVAAGSSLAIAHDIPAKLEMNAFVKVDRNQAQLVIRMPLYVLGTAQFPALGRELDLAGSGPATQRALAGIAASIAIWENGTRLVPSSSVGRLSLPSDRSFGDYDQAVKHVATPLEAGTAIYTNQGFFDAHLTYPITSAGSRFTIRTMVAPELGDFVKLIVRYMPADGSSRAFLIASRSGQVPLNPAWYQAAGSFVCFGMGHILSGTDHLLFLLCLIIPFRRLRGLLPVITAFTLGHSITLLGTAYNLAPSGAWFPPFVEAAIAASIVYMALENITGANLQRRWIITGLFGLVHGFGFSYALKETLQFAGSHLLVSLLAFNVGIEIGQLMVLAAMLAGLALLFRLAFEKKQRIGVIVLSALVAHTAWHWMIARGEVLWKSPAPELNANSLMTLARWVAVLLIAVGAARFVAEWLEHRSSRAGEPAIAALRVAQESSTSTPASDHAPSAQSLVSET